MDTLSYLLLGGTGSRRPPAVQQPAIAPPFDPNDPGGLVHTVLPPEQTIPTAPSRTWMNGDAWGVELPEDPPWVPGCNTTPLRMIMSYLLPWYSLPQYGGTKQVDKNLTAHCKRGYWTHLLSKGNSDEAGLSLSQFLDLIAYVQSWGFFTPIWPFSLGNPRNANWAETAPFIEPFLHALVDRGLAEKSSIVLGGELNNWNRPGPDGLDDIIAHTAAICRPADLDLWLHFGRNYPGWPIGGFQYAPRPDLHDEVEAWWAWLHSLGVKGICVQLDQDDTAGAQGGRMWGIRYRLAHASPELRCVAFETCATNQMYYGDHMKPIGMPGGGHVYDERYGKLRSWQLVCGTRGWEATDAPAVSGSNNGLSYPDGTPIWKG